MRTVVIAAGLALFMACCSAASAAEPLKSWETLRTTAPLSPALRTGREDVGDAEIYFAVYGKGEPVILLHPALGNSDYWANQIGPLSQEFQVIVVDLRGHGRSSGPVDALSYRLMARDVVRLIKDLKLKDPAIVGWGDGAVVGLELALRYPKRIGKLVAFGLAFDRSGLQPRPDQTPTFIEYVHKAQADHALLSGNPAAFTRLLDGYEALWEREPNYTADDLANLKLPVVIMAAEHDEWVKPEHMVKAAELIPSARLVTLPKTSHFAPWQAAKNFDDALLMALRH